MALDFFNSAQYKLSGTITKTLKSAIISQTILSQGGDSDILICEPKQLTSGTKVTLTLKVKGQTHSANTPKS